MDTKEDREEAIQLLRDVSTGKYKLYENGICSLINQEIGGFSDYFLSARMLEWVFGEKADVHYPVSHPTLENWEAYDLFVEKGWQMNGRSPYGMERRRLAKYLADELENSVSVLRLPLAEH
tara:strand:+ start:177 stop:539 length:363 start_codon:yes stop_codon:yes gene_type:complete